MEWLSRSNHPLWAREKSCAGHLLELTKTRERAKTMKRLNCASRQSQETREKARAILLQYKAHCTEQCVPKTNGVMMMMKMIIVVPAIVLNRSSQVVCIDWDRRSEQTRVTFIAAAAATSPPLRITLDCTIVIVSEHQFNSTDSTQLN